MKKIILLAATCTICSLAQSQTWNLTGNAGTNASTNFVGTTDNVAFKIRTKNVVRLTVNAAGKVGIGTTAPVFKLDVKAGSINTDSVYRIGGNTVLSAGGSFNTFVGISSGFSNTTGSSNTATGYAALSSNNTGYANTALGMYALFFNTSGIENTASGRRALYNTTTGNSNTANGVESLYSNTSGDYNTSTGSYALHSNTTGFQNTATGKDALYSNTTGSNNTANGFNALHNNTNGTGNTANGLNALYNNTAGFFNTANGTSSAVNTTTGYYNTTNGVYSLYENTTGHSNTVNGVYALYSNTTGTGNTANGVNALYYNSTGHFNTVLGYHAGVNAGFNPSNFTAIGYNAGHVASNSNEIEIGNTSVGWIAGQVGWSNWSDMRIKDNIQSNVPGLSFITRLNPVTYNLNIHRQNEMCGINDTNEWEGKYDIEKITQTGFLAQEVEQAALACNYDFNGVKAPHGNAKLYSVQYASFVVPLVKAVQELDKTNDELKIQNTELESRIEKLELLLTEKSSLTHPFNNSSAYLIQNNPNPFTEKTIIRFNIPASSQNAALKIYSADGKEIKAFHISTRGDGQIEINSNTLAAGIYNYVLLIDGEVTGSRQMILTR